MTSSHQVYRLIFFGNYFYKKRLEFRYRGFMHIRTLLLLSLTFGCISHGSAEDKTEEANAALIHDLFYLIICLIYLHHYFITFSGTLCPF